jgi:hypothetical protein
MVRATLRKNGQALSGANLTLAVPKGSAGAVTDHRNGTYDFTVTRAANGVYPVTISYQGTSTTRRPLVFNDVLAAGAG